MSAHAHATDREARPSMLPFRAEGVPPALKAERRWVLWRLERDHSGRRWTKRPYQQHGSLAKTNDPSTWCAFDAALEALHHSERTPSRESERRVAREYRAYSGLGFVLGDGWAGVDVDHYTGDSLAGKIPGYHELSPSGTGIKVIGRASRVGGEINCATRPETYTTWSGPRFFTITGHLGVGDPRADLTTFLNTWFPVDRPSVQVEGSGVGYRLAAVTSDADLLVQMAGSDHGEELYALWQGDITKYGGDRSRADLALCCHLAFWTDYDMTRVDRLFRQSGLMRAKWDTNSYRLATLRKAARA